MKVHHAFLSGLVAGLVLDKEALVILLIGLALGAAGGFLARELAGAFRWARRRLSGEAPAPPYTMPARPRRPDPRKPW
jgi:hypothetical protein